MRLALAAISVCFTTTLLASPYAGQQERELKALSPAEIEDYLEGRGMGFARPAELNGYPGPMHVLELAEPLALTAGQREATAALMQRHKREARALGRELVEAERTLERLFRDRSATAASIEQATARAAHLQGRIRASHLSTHLEQARLLDEAQVKRYAELRGYAGHAPSGERPKFHGRHHH
jgi:hypothetical protein